VHDGCSSQGHQLLWIAVYSDGQQLPECDGERCHVFAEIDLSRLIEFILTPFDDQVTVPSHVFKVTTDTTPIFFRRYQQMLNSGDDTWAEYACLGFKKIVGDRAVKVYQFISSNGSTLLTDDFQAV
jgi:hypothetical protein